MDKNPKLHLGHFERIRQRVMGTDVYNIDDVLALEMILQGVMRRCDTNEVAKRILAHFGSMENLCKNHNYWEFIKIKGIGEKAAEGIEAFFILCEFAFYQGNSAVELKLTNREDIEKYLLKIFRDCDSETVVLFIMNSVKRVVHFSVLTESGVDSIAENYSKVRDWVHAHKGNQIITAHKHIGDSEVPTDRECSAIIGLCAYCKKIGLEFTDHIIVNDKDCFSLQRADMLDNLKRRAIEKMSGRRIFPE